MNSDSSNATWDLLAYARQVLRQEQLHDWHVKWDQAKRRAGACHYQNKTLSFSQYLFATLPMQTMKEVVLHEVAHALAGPGHGHNQVWKAHAIRLGAPPEARLPSTVPQPPAPWVGTCQYCGNQRKLYSSPRRVSSCGNCSTTFSVERIYQWTHRGVPTQPGGQYAKELRSTLKRFGLAA